MSSDAALCSIWLPTGWKWQYLEDMCERVSVGHVGETSTFFCEAEGVPFLRSQNVRAGYLDLKDVRFITEEFHLKTKKSQLKRGDILIVRVGHNRGDCAVVPEGMDDLNCANMVFARPTSLNYADFFGYFFNSPFGRASLLAVSSGSAQAVLNTKAVAKVLVPVPPENTALEIGRVLRSFDDKIQLNHQINQTLEQMAQAIFKSWFVDFEPVKAKIAARERWYALQSGNESASPDCYAGELADQPINIDLDTYMNHAAMQAISGKDAEQLAQMQVEKPEEYAELYATAELFPSAMQDSELGEIPEGWRAGVLGDIACFTNGRILKEDLSLETYISTENMIENRMGVCRASSLPSSDSVPAFKPGEILISNIRPYFKKIWLSNMHGGRSPDVLGFSSKVNGASEYLFNLLYQDKFFEYMMLTSKGAKMPRGDKQAIMQFTSAIPDSDLMKYFSDQVRSFYTLSSVHTRESESLAVTRDTLLPKLLSGELSVADIESEVEA